MERKILKITNCKQFELLVRLMEKNTSVARGYLSFGNSKSDFNNIWNGFSDQLNSLGPPIRGSTEWQKVWNDFKGKIKMKLAHNKKELKATGGGSNKLYVFSALEESVIDVLLLKEVTETSRKTFGFSASSTASSSSTEALPSTSLTNHIVPPVLIEDEDAYVDVYITNDTPEPAPTIDREVGSEIENRPISKTISETQRKTRSSGRKKAFEEERRRLLEIQTKSIVNTEKHSKEIARYTRKMYELKLKKIDLLKENMMQKNKLKKKSLELQLRVIEYKEKKKEILIQKNN